MSKPLASREPFAEPSPAEDRDALLGALQSYLQARGHTPATRCRYGAAASHFLRWLQAQPPERQRIDAQTVRLFLEQPVCTPSDGSEGHGDQKSVRAALNQLLQMQGHSRLRPPAPVASASIEALIGRFDAHLDQICGLAPATRWYHRRHARAFLQALFGTAPVAPERITPEALIQFVTAQARAHRPGSVGVLAHSLRSLLRFLQLTGEVSVELMRAVPRPPNWSAAALPPSLSAGELERFWAAFDRASAVGKRDYAMARCLADLGLRCQEVAQLRLEDIDWRSASLCLRATKSRRAARLPLPPSTGAALAEYLREARPATASRAVFIQHCAPRGAAAPTTVRGAMRRAFARAGLPWSGTHILRHTAATRMMQRGVSLKEVADVLRHRSIDTTRTYTKVALPQLARVALPWPGRSP